MAIADISGQTFGLPGTTGYGGASFIGKSQAELAAEKAGIAPAQGQALLPNINEDIFQMEGITDDYYNNYSTLKSYVESMSQQGVDVTRPDFTQPDGGEAFRTYKKLEGYLMNTANRLKNELAVRNRYEPMIARDEIRMAPGFDPRTQFMSETPQDQMYYSTELLPEVEVANKKLNEILYSGGDAGRYDSEVRQPLINELNRALSQTTSPAQKARIQANIDALARPTWQTDKTLNQINARNLGKGATPDGVNMARKVISIVKGYLPETNYTVEQVDGQTAAVNKELAGYNYGVYQDLTKPGSTKETAKTFPRVIDKVVHFPDETVRIFFKNADNGQPIPPEDISNATGDTVLGLLKQSNPKSMGKLPQYDLTAEGSFYEPDVYETPENYKIAQGYGETMMNKVKGSDASVKQVKTSLKKDITSIPEVSTSTWKFDETDIKEQAKSFNIGGVTVKIAKLNNKFYYVTDDGVEEYNSVDELLSSLEKQGALDQYAKGAEYAPQTTTSPAADTVQTSVNKKGKYGLK